jgi:formylglycine-generating enzyme required for sulfatase activity
MGSTPDDNEARENEKDQHEVYLPLYYMACYPVTVAQFQAFVDATAYPWEYKDRQGPPNHPVVYVSWHDARAYCAWLTERLRTWEETPALLRTLLGNKHWYVTLPSEAEWEKAARGTDGRHYPWGNEPDPNRANYDETGIDTTSTVGCFPGGASQPYGVEELSGNVWEWTRSLWGQDWDKPMFTYPYRPDDGREDLNAPENMLRVLRGGSFLDSQRAVRCAYRFRDGARFFGYIGFRLVVVEGLP